MYITRNRRQIEGNGAPWDKCGGVTRGVKVGDGCVEAAPCGCKGLLFMTFIDRGVIFFVVSCIRHRYGWNEDGNTNRFFRIGFS